MTSIVINAEKNKLDKRARKAKEWKKDLAQQKINELQAMKDERARQWRIENGII